MAHTLKISISLIIISLFSSNIFSQYEILFEDVDNYTVFQEQTFGPNGKHFLYNYVRFDFAMPSISEDQIGIKYRLSYNFSYGLKYKFKVLKWFAIGTDFTYTVQNYYLNDVFLFYLNNNQKDKLLVNSLGSELFFRINFGRTGNVMGKYIDIGGFGTYNMNTNYTIKTINKNPVSFQAKKEVFHYKGIDIVEMFRYGGVVRIGYSKYSLFTKYRLSDLFNAQTLQETANLDLPKFFVGIEIGLF